MVRILQEFLIKSKEICLKETKAYKKKFLHEKMFYIKKFFI